jgi:hypothetical protein
LLLPPNASTFTPSRPSADPNMSSGTLAATPTAWLSPTTASPPSTKLLRNTQCY